MKLRAKKAWWAARYAALTVRHKWFVLLAGLRLGVPLCRLLVHDLSKFGPSELFAYGRQFFGDRGDPLGFSRAWLHHQNVNPHHWEYWIPRTGHDRGGLPGGEPLPMPEAFVREMVADWLGASRAYGGEWPRRDDWKWFRKTYPKIQSRIHPETCTLILQLLYEIEVRS